MPMLPDSNSQQGDHPIHGEPTRPVVSRSDIDVAMGYIERHACEGLTPFRVVAETQTVPLVTFHGHFLAATGLTLQAAIRMRQLEEMRRLLLRTELSLPFIAEQCGFPDVRAAADAFREAACEVPHALREPNPATVSKLSPQTCFPEKFD